MNISIIIFKQIIFMFLLMCIGFLCTKTKLISKDSTKTLSNILLYVSAPASIISSYIMTYDSQKIKLILYSFLLAIFLHLLYILFVSLLHLDNPVFKCAAVIPNVGFMGIPIISSVLGEYAIYLLSPFIVINDLFIWIYCGSIMSENEKLNIKEMIFNPAAISIVIGFIILFTNITVPEIIINVFDSVKGLNTPLAMLLLGSYLANVNYSDAIKDIKKIILPIVLKTLLFPIAVLVFLRVFTNINFDLRVIMMIAASSPTAFCVAIFAEKYNNNFKIATETVCLSTLASLISIPLFTYLLFL